MVVRVWTISGRCRKLLTVASSGDKECECKILVKQNRQQRAELIQTITPLA